MERLNEDPRGSGRGRNKGGTSRGSGRRDTRECGWDPGSFRDTRLEGKAARGSEGTCWKGSIPEAGQRQTLTGSSPRVQADCICWVLVSPMKHKWEGFLLSLAWHLARSLVAVVSLSGKVGYTPSRACGLEA